jgi:hypothetical protein
MKKTCVGFLSLCWCLGALLPSCSKENNLNQSTSVDPAGEQCSGAGDEGCGVGSVCVLGQCRHGCTNDAECPKGTICVGDRPPYGCTTAEESACQGDGDCAKGLACGLDGKCRHPCEADSDCPRNEHRCVGLTCASEAEADFDQWVCQFDATTDEERWGRRVWYRDGTTWSCNVEKPGGDFIDTCNRDGRVGFAAVFASKDVAQSGVLWDRDGVLACAAADCGTGAYACPMTVECAGEPMCEACTQQAWSEPFACRPSQNPSLQQCTCIDDPSLLLDCGYNGNVQKNIYTVLREPTDCRLVIPDAIHYTGNDAFWALSKDKALVVSDQGVLEPGRDYELTDGTLVFTAEACARAHLTAFVCEGSCTRVYPGNDPVEGSCADVQDH